VEKYIRERDRYEKMAAAVTRRLTEQLLDAAIPHVPTFRAKEPESLKGKLMRDRKQLDFTLFEKDFAPHILDLAGVRVMLYRPQDETPTCNVIERLFPIPEGARFRRDLNLSKGYRGRHRVVGLSPEMLSEHVNTNLHEVLCEVQVVLFTHHVWNELEHNIGYKTPHGKPSSEQKSLLSQLETLR
jgi:ppGpp synthetase/RelA/SpoT-type nucleotidyltranferase